MRYEEPVYNRNDPIMVLNDSLTSLNESKDVPKTRDNLNLVNESKYNSRKEYSTNEPDKRNE